jgi:hypothetical protein
LLDISGHEIDRVLAFVKYVVVGEVTEEKRAKVKDLIQEQFA